MGPGAGAGAVHSQDGAAGGGGVVPVVGGEPPPSMAGQNGAAARPAGAPATEGVDVLNPPVPTRCGLSVAEVTLAVGELPAVPRASVGRDVSSPMAVDAESYTGRAPARLLPSRPRAHALVHLPYRLLPAPALLPGSARVAPLGGKVAPAVEISPMAVSGVVARVRGLTVQ